MGRSEDTQTVVRVRGYITGRPNKRYARDIVHRAIGRLAGRDGVVRQPRRSVAQDGDGIVDDGAAQGLGVIATRSIRSRITRYVHGHPSRRQKRKINGPGVTLIYLYESHVLGNTRKRPLGLERPVNRRKVRRARPRDS